MQLLGEIKEEKKKTRSVVAVCMPDCWFSSSALLCLTALAMFTKMNMHLLLQLSASVVLWLQLTLTNPSEAAALGVTQANAPGSAQGSHVLLGSLTIPHTLLRRSEGTALPCTCAEQAGCVASSTVSHGRHCVPLCDLAALCAECAALWPRGRERTGRDPEQKQQRVLRQHLPTKKGVDNHAASLSRYSYWDKELELRSVHLWKMARVSFRASCRLKSSFSLLLILA